MTHAKASRLQHYSERRQKKKKTRIITSVQKGHYKLTACVILKSDEDHAHDSACMESIVDSVYVEVVVPAKARILGRASLLSASGWNFMVSHFTDACTPL